MILKDLETVDKQLKKDPDESGGGATLVQIQSHQIPTTLHGVPINHVTGVHLNDQRSIASRLEHPSYLPSSVIHNLHGVNGDSTLNTLASLHGVGAANMIGQYSTVAVTAAAAAAAAAVVSRAGQVAKQQIMCKNDLSSLSSAPNSVGSMLPINADILGLKTLSGDNQQATFVSTNQTNSSEWQTNVMPGYNSSPSPIGMVSGSRGGGADSDDSSRKRQVRLLKNREAAKECRRKKKEYVKCLENRVAVLENQNKALIEELKTLKELYCRKEKTEI